MNVTFTTGSILFTVGVLACAFGIRALTRNADLDGILLLGAGMLTLRGAALTSAGSRGAA